MVNRQASGRFRAAGTRAELGSDAGVRGKGQGTPEAHGKASDVMLLEIKMK